MPHLVQTAGPSVEVRPYRVLRSTDPDLGAAFTEVLREENVRFVADANLQNRDAHREFLKIFPVKSWSDLYKRCRHWKISENGDVFTIHRWKRASNARSLEPDADLNAVRGGMTLEAAADYLVAEVRHSEPRTDA